MELQELFGLIDSRKEELFSLLSSLVKINSETFGALGGNEKEIAEFCKKICRENNLFAETYSPLEVSGFEDHPERIKDYNLENRLNFLTRLNGKEDLDGLMIMGHSDTVKVGDMENWSFDPFCGEIRDGKILGRGANDDKFALACTIFLLKLLKETGFVPKKNILFCAYCDEEYGGSHGALAAVLRNPCETILNVDGMEGEIWHCGSGGQDVEFSFKTVKTAESAEGCARVVGLILDILEGFKSNRKEELGKNRFYKGTSVAELPMYYLEVKIGDDGNDLGVGKIAFEFFTDKTEDEIWQELDSLNSILAERLLPYGIESCGFKPLCRFFHYVFCEPDSTIVKDILKAYDSAGAAPPRVCGSCLSDYSVISKYGSKNSLTFGIAKAFSDLGGPHQNDEFVSCERLVELTKILAAYIYDTLR